MVVRSYATDSLVLAKFSLFYNSNKLLRNLQEEENLLHKSFFIVEYNISIRMTKNES